MIVRLPGGVPQELADTFHIDITAHTHIDIHTGAHRHIHRNTY